MRLSRRHACAVRLRTSRTVCCRVRGRKSVPVYLLRVLLCMRPVRVVLCNSHTRTCYAGGHFIGTVPNAHRLVRILRSAPARKWSNRVCSLEFDERVFVSNAPDAVIPAFGARYTFTLSDAVDSVPEYLVHFDVLRVSAHATVFPFFSSFLFVFWHCCFAAYSVRVRT